MGFSLKINHPAIGDPPFLETSIYTYTIIYTFLYQFPTHTIIRILYNPVVKHDSGTFLIAGPPAHVLLTIFEGHFDVLSTFFQLGLRGSTPLVEGKKPTWNQGLLPSNLGVSCQFSHHPILWNVVYRDSTIGLLYSPIDWLVMASTIPQLIINQQVLFHTAHVSNHKSIIHF